MTDVYDELKDYWVEALNLNPELIWSAKELGLSQSKRAFDNWDNLLLVGGEKGVSKSTCGDHIGIWQQGGPGNGSWEDCAKKFLGNNVIYACPVRRLVPRIIDKYSMLPKFSSVVVDEIKDLHKRQFATVFNIEMAKFVGKNRKWVNPETGEDVGNKTLIMCLDNVMSLDKEVRNTANIHVQVMARGIGAIFRPLRLAYVTDPFFSDIFQKILMKALSAKENTTSSSSLLSIQEQLKLYSKMPTFDGVVVYPNLDMVGKPEQRVFGPVEQFYVEMDGKSKSEKDDPNDDDPKMEKFKKLVLTQVKNLVSTGRTQIEALADIGDPVPIRTFQRWHREEKKQQKLPL